LWQRMDGSRIGNPRAFACSPVARRQLQFHLDLHSLLHLTLCTLFSHLTLCTRFNR
jgi:hypothetical protein